MKIKKAVIPAAGLGTRVLPATKSMPKEMLPIVDKPAIQYIVEEAVKSGIEDICIITSRGKDIVTDHFDRSPELEERLLSTGKKDIYEEVVSIANLANITYIRQKETKGLGDAVYCAKPFIGEEPFAVLYGDDVIISDIPVCGQLIEAYEQYNLGCVGIKEVSMDAIHRYSSMKVSSLKDNLFSITDMIEKPATNADVFSLYSILGRCVLPSSIFNLLENLPRGAGNEYQLTDAMKILAQKEGMVGVDFIGKRYDMGNKLGIMMANVEVALSHPSIGADFRAYLKELTKSL